MPEKLNRTYISQALAEKLLRISEYPVSAIVAPIGYGKTRAVSWWAETCQKQLPEARILRQSIVTDSLTDFWRGFCRSLRPWPELKAEMEELGMPAGPQSRGLLLELLWDAAADARQEIFYVIDDLHVLSNPAAAELLAFVSIHLPERMHLVLLSRNAIFDQVDRLRLGDRLWELHADDLRLGEEGIREYARRSGLSLKPDEAKHLAETTEGWFSMVYLNLQTYLQNGRWPDSGAGIYPLIDEVLLQPLPGRQRDFLVRLGLPDDFTAEMAGFLWPDGDAAELLHQLTRRNAFVSVTAGVYRYHNMLRACTRVRFSALPRERQQAAYERLGQWYERSGEYARAAECYEHSGDWEALARAVGLDRGLSFGPERLPLARRWMAACPERVLLRHPQAILVFILMLFYARDFTEMRRYHALFERSMERCTDLPQTERDQLEGEALLRLSFLYFNDISAMSAYHRRIHALIPADRNPWTQGSPSVLMLYHSQSGALDRENAEMQTCMPIYSCVADGHGSGAAQLMQGETALLRGDFADAAICCRQAEQQAQEQNEFSICTAAGFLSAWLALYEDPPQDGFDRLDRTADLLRRRHRYRLLTTVELGRAWLGAGFGREEQIPAWLNEEPGSIAQVFPLVVPIFQVIVNRVLLARGQWAQVAARTAQLVRVCTAAHFALCLLYVHLQSAEALMHLEKEADARAALQAAWSLAQPDGIVLPFAEADPCLDPLLDGLLDPEERERLRTLAGRFRAARTETPERPLWEDCGLTPREKEIAELALARKSSREIAEILCVSVKSVDNRLNTIYEKLGLGGKGRNKRQALIERLEHLSRS